MASGPRATNKIAWIATAASLESTSDSQPNHSSGVIRSTSALTRIYESRIICFYEKDELPWGDHVPPFGIDLGYEW